MYCVFAGETLLADKSSVLKQRFVNHADKCVETDPLPAGNAHTETTQAAAAPQHEHAQRKISSSSAQLLEEMKYLQEENKALKEQVSISYITTSSCLQ